MQLVVGRIRRAHGLHGEVSVEVRTDDPDLRFAPGSVLAAQPSAHGPLTVASARRHAGRLLVRFVEVVDRTAAETLPGTFLLADSATSPPNRNPDEFWDHELVGSTAVSRAGKRLGEVVDVLHLPSEDVLVVRLGEGRQALVPFVAEIVPEVDLAGGRLVVDPPAGLLQLNSGCSS